MFNRIVQNCESRIKKRKIKTPCQKKGILIEKIKTNRRDAYINYFANGYLENYKSV